MGFLDKLKRKKDQVADEVKEQTTTSSKPTGTNSTSSDQTPPSGKKIKRYTSDGKPIYE
jgi:hypothetical protein